MIGAPSIFKLIRKDSTLSRVLPTFAFSCAENSARWKWKIPLVGCVCDWYVLARKEVRFFPDEIVWGNLVIIGNLVIMRFSVHLCQRKFHNKHLRFSIHVSHALFIPPLVLKSYASCFSRWVVSTRRWIIEISSWGTIPTRFLFDFAQHAAQDDNMSCPSLWRYSCDTVQKARIWS
jgi:hypothetical protein